MIVTLLLSIESSLQKKLTKIAAVGRFFVHLDQILVAAGRS